MRCNLLDHGYVQLIEVWGSDARFIESARMSTDKGFKGWGGVELCKTCKEAGRFADDDLYIDPAVAIYAMRNCKECEGTGKTLGDEKLLKFLYDHKHMTPFEMGGATFEVYAPIVVFREWHRHRTQFYNEMSARYIPLPDVNYVPSNQRLKVSQASTTNKQAQGTSAFQMTDETIAEDLSALNYYYAHGQKLYEKLLQRGWPKELARLPVPVARYSKMRASANLRNWLQFLTLRMDEAAQWEIRQYANVVADILDTAFPHTMKIFRGRA